MVPTAYGVLLLVLALVKATKHWKLYGFRGQRLLVVLIKDQVMYFTLYVVYHIQ